MLDLPDGYLFALDEGRLKGSDKMCFSSHKKTISAPPFFIDINDYPILIKRYHTFARILKRI
jgi:hypothetical protein